DEKGKIIRSFGTEQDITAQAQQQEQLQESQTKLRATLNSIGDAVISTDTNGFIVNMNPVAEDLTGWKLSDAQGKALTKIFKIVNAKTNKRADNPVKQVLTSGKIIGLANHTILIAKNGNEFQIADSGSPIKDSQGTIIGVVLVFRDVTEDYRVREELQESEARFKQIADVIEEAFVISDIKTVAILYASPAFEKIWGRPVSKLYEDIKHWNEGIHPDDRPKTKKAWKRMIKTGERFDEQYRVIRPDGTIRWVRSEHYPIFDESGKVYRVAEVVQDITERLEAEEALRESESRFKLLANEIDDVFVVSDTLTDTFLYVSPAFEKIWGRPANEMYDDPRKLDIGIHPDDVKHIQDEWARMKKDGRQYEKEFRVVRPDGSIRWIRGRWFPVRNESGQVYRVAEINQDITNQKETALALRESEERFQQLADKIEDVFLLTDVDKWIILFANPAFEKIWGRSVQDLYEDSEEYNRGIHPDDIKRLQLAFRDVAWHGGSPMDEEYRVIHSDGSERWVRSRGYPIHDKNGKVYRMAEIVQDINARKQAELKLQRSQALYRQAERMGKLGHWEWDHLNNRLVSCSDQFARIYEMTVKEALKYFSHRRSELTVIHPDDRERYEQYLHDSEEQGEGINIEFRIITKSGNLRHIYLQSEVVLNEESKIIRSFGTEQDITARKQAEEAQARRAEEFAALYETSLEIGAQTELNALLNTIVRRGATLLNSAHGALLLLQPDNKTLQLTAVYNLTANISENLFVRLGEGVAGRVAESGEPLTITDYQNWAGRKPELPTTSTQRILCVPLKRGTDVIGVLTVADDKKKEAFEENDVQVLSSFAAQAAIAIENARSFERIQQTTKEMTMLFHGSQTLSNELHGVEDIAKISANLFIEMIPTFSNAYQYPECEISLFDPEKNTLRVIASFSLEDDEVTIREDKEEIGHVYSCEGYPATMHALENLLPLTVRASDPKADPAELAFLKEHEMASVVALPLVVKGKAIGLVELNSYDKELKLTQAEINLAMTLANQAAVAIENALVFEELNQAQSYITNIINSMPSVLVGVDADGNITQWNDEAHRKTGLSAKQAFGLPLGDAFPRLEYEMDRVHKAMKTLEVQSNNHREYEVDGHTHYEDITVYPLIAEGMSGAVIRVDDVTEQVRLEEMMIQSEKMLSVGGLAVGMAHEINNPLAGMVQTASVVKNRLSQNIPANRTAALKAGTTIEAIREYMESRGIPRMLEAINESGGRAGSIVDNMLSFARRGNTVISSIDMPELLEMALELAATDYDLKKQYDFKNIEIVKEYEADLPLVLCEGNKIQQVLLNILQNGAQAMQENFKLEPGKTPRFILRLAKETKNEQLKIEIEDNGIGMDEYTRKRVFEPFFTTKPVGEGTGLGLSVSYFIVTENHGGQMDVESEPGKGTTFIVRLPFEKG
ncbi:MAG: PAS domain-containing protein, partial [Anaerolineae bacterium]|nr:PAS domain-containing protein [Anaerolineae bacterium]